MPAKFDELMTQLGTGKWSIMYFAMTSAWLFLRPFQVLSGVFYAPLLNHTCIPPALDQAVEIASDSCSYFIDDPSSGERTEIPCTEFEYDTSVFENTLTSEFDLVCDRSTHRATYQSIYTSASIFSSIVAGYIADRLGRKPVVVVTHLVYIVLGFGLAFLNNFSAILAFRGIMGCLGISTMYILSLEVCEMKNRATVGIMTGLPWAFGTMALGGMAYLVRDWRWLQIYNTLPFILMLPGYILMDESPRWLIVRGEFDRAIEVLQRAARWNKTQLPSAEALKKLMVDIQEEIKQMEEVKFKKSDKKKWSLPTIFSTPAIRIIIIFFGVSLFVADLSYSGLTLNGSNFSADPFLYMFFTGLMEVPGYAFTAPVVNRFGRRWPTILGYSISGVVILILIFVPEDITWLVMTLVMLGKLINSGSFMIIYMYAAEVLPTEVRFQGMGIHAVSCRLGATIAPYITETLGPIVSWGPSVIFGAVSVIPAVGMLPMPETLNNPMPDTVHDLDEISLASSCLRKRNGNKADEKDDVAMETA